MTPLEYGKHLISRSINHGGYDQQTGEPLPDVYKFLKEALNATTYEQFLLACLQAEDKLRSPELAENFDFATNDAILATSGILAWISAHEEEQVREMLEE